MTIAVGPKPQISLVLPENNARFNAGDTITMQGSGQQFNFDTKQYETVPNNQMHWVVGFMHDEHMHPLGTNPIGPTATYVIPSQGHEYNGNVALRFELVVTSDYGLQASASSKIYPNMVIQRFESEPNGQEVIVDHKTTYTTPFELKSVPGFVHSVQLPSNCVNIFDSNFWRKMTATRLYPLICLHMSTHINLTCTVYMYT